MQLSDCSGACPLPRGSTLRGPTPLKGTVLLQGQHRKSPPSSTSPDSVMSWALSGAGGRRSAEVPGAPAALCSSKMAQGVGAWAPGLTRPTRGHTATSGSGFVMRGWGVATGTKQGETRAMLMFCRAQVSPCHREPPGPKCQCRGGGTLLWRDSWVQPGLAVKPRGHTA